MDVQGNHETFVDMCFIVGTVDVMPTDKQAADRSKMKICGTVILSKILPRHPSSTFACGLRRLAGRVLNMPRFSDNVTPKDRMGYLENALKGGAKTPIKPLKRPLRGACSFLL